MGLLQNGTLNAQNPGRRRGGTATASEAGNLRASLGINGSTQINRFVSDAEVSNLSAIPFGYTQGFFLPLKAGGISSSKEARGEATAFADITEGRPISGTAAGSSTASATGQLVVSGSGTSDGFATVTASIVAALNATGTSAGSSDAEGTLSALGNISGVAAGSSTATAVIYATGALSGTIASATELEASEFSAYLLDQQDVESGLTLRQALRLIAAATAGKVSGAEGTTITIRNPIADSKDRIIATVDASGNRSGVTYDLD
jgi:hypothetical protein